MDYNNIFLLDDSIKIGQTEKTKLLQGEIIQLLKDNDFSLSDAAWLFKSIIQTLGDTPISKL